MTKHLQKPNMPAYCFCKGGWLYFQKWYDGKRYVAPFNLRDTAENRGTAGKMARNVVDAMELGYFEAANFPFLAKQLVETERNYPLFRDYAGDWLDRKLGLRPATHKNYTWMIKNHLLPSFGGVAVDCITKPTVERWLLRKAKARTWQLANEALRRLKQIIADAEGDYGFTARLQLVKSLRNQDPDYEPLSVYSVEEASKLYCVMGNRLRTMMLCSLLGGLRTGEVIALQRADVLFDEDVIFVRSTMSETGVRMPPKTRAGRRRVPMHPVLRAHLEVHLRSHDHDYVFITQRGSPFYRRQSFAKEYKNAICKAGVRDLRWYAFRHLYASLRYASSDQNPVLIASHMGHTKPSVGLDIYARAMPDLGCRFEEVLFPVLTGDKTKAA